MLDGWLDRDVKKLPNILRPIPDGRKGYLLTDEKKIFKIRTHDISDYFTPEIIELWGIYWKYKKRGDPWGVGWWDWPCWFDELVSIGDSINWPIQSREI